MSYENVTVAKEESLGIVTINRPKALNALNSATLKELLSAFDEMAQAADVKVVILTGGGDRAFVAGADISEMVNYAPLEAEAFAALGQRLMFKIERLPKPVIAAMHGFALGGGCELAMACDIRIASESARFGQPEINLGIIPGGGGTQRLPRLVGLGTAFRLIYTGEMVDAVEALRIGLVDEVVSADELRSRTLALAATIATKSPVALQLAKEAIRSSVRAPLDEGLRHEQSLFAVAFATKDKSEGVAAFLEKRQARFTGE
jgi:enoyl-CoA hydratase